MLFGRGTVHGLNDPEHHHHKAALFAVLTPERVAALTRRVAQE